MWKALGLWLCVQKAKELWFRGIFNLHSESNKGLAVTLRAGVQPDWGSGRGEEGMERSGQTGSQTSFVPPLYFSLSLFLLKSSISSLHPHLHPPPFLSPSQSCKCMTWGINWMGRRQHREEQYISIMFADLYLLCEEKHRCYASASLPLLLMAQYESCGRDVWLSACLEPSQWLGPTLALWPPIRASPAQLVCVSWRNCLLFCTDQINRPCLWGQEVGGVVSVCCLALWV